MQRYQLTEAGFRTKFFDSKAEFTENAVEIPRRIDGLLSILDGAKVEETYEGLRHFLLKEQVLKS